MLSLTLCYSQAQTKNSNNHVYKSLLQTEYQIFLYPDSVSLYFDKANLCLQNGHERKALETINRLSLDQVKDTNSLKAYFELRTYANFALERWEDATISWINYLNLIEEAHQKPRDLVFMILLLANQKDSISSIEYYDVLKGKCPNILSLNELYAATTFYEVSNHKISFIDKLISGLGQAKMGYYKQATTASIFQIVSLVLPIWMITQGVYFTPAWLGYYLITTSNNGNLRQIKRLSIFERYQQRLKALEKVTESLSK